MNSGNEVQIFAEFRNDGSKVHKEVLEYKLMEKTHSFSVPSNKLRRLLTGIYLFLTNFFKHPSIKVAKKASPAPTVSATITAGATFE